MTSGLDQVNSPTSSEGQRFKTDLHGVGQDVVKVKNDLVSLGHDLADSAKSGVAAAKQEASQTIDHAQERGEKLIQSLSHKIADNPLASIGIAVGAGLLLGMFFIRPRS